MVNNFSVLLEYTAVFADVVSLATVDVAQAVDPG